MRALPLSASTQAMLDRIRTYEWTLCVYGMSQSRAVRLVKARTEIRINGAGIPPPFNNVYRRYVLELVKTFRTRTGEQLAQAGYDRTLLACRLELKQCTADLARGRPRRCGRGKVATDLPASVLGRKWGQPLNQPAPTAPAGLTGRSRTTIFFPLGTA
jgi:hypothetical protein